MNHRRYLVRASCSLLVMLLLAGAALAHAAWSFYLVWGWAAIAAPAGWLLAVFLFGRLHWTVAGRTS